MLWSTVVIYRLVPKWPRPMLRQRNAPRWPKIPCRDPSPALQQIMDEKCHNCYQLLLLQLLDPQLVGQLLDPQLCLKPQLFSKSHVFEASFSGQGRGLSGWPSSAAIFLKQSIVPFESDPPVANWNGSFSLLNGMYLTLTNSNRSHHFVILLSQTMVFPPWGAPCRGAPPRASRTASASVAARCRRDRWPPPRWWWPSGRRRRWWPRPWDLGPSSKGSGLKKAKPTAGSLEEFWGRIVTQKPINLFDMFRCLVHFRCLFKI